MSTTRRSLAFKHFNDCQQTGCPGHIMELAYYNTSDTVGCKIDGEERFVFDDGAWEALLKLEREMHAYLTGKL